MDTMVILKYDISNPSFVNLVDNKKIDLFTYKQACILGCLGVRISTDDRVHPNAMKILQECERIGIIVIGVMYGNPSLEIIHNVFPPKEGRIPCLSAVDGIDYRLEYNIELIYKEWSKFPWLYTTHLFNTGNAKYCPHWFQWFGNFQYENMAIEIVAHEYTNGFFRGDSHAPREFRGAGKTNISQLLITGNDLKRKAGIKVESKFS